MFYNPVKSFERRSDTEIYNVLTNAHTLNDDDKERYEVEWGLSFDEDKKLFSTDGFVKNTPGSIVFGGIGIIVIGCHFFGLSILGFAIEFLAFLGKALLIGGAVVGTAKVSKKIGEKLIVKINGKVINDIEEE